MNRSKRRRGVVSLAFLLTLTTLFTGCFSSSLHSFTWNGESVPANLDPQTASSSEDVIAVTHLFSGLYRLSADGTPQPDCAQNCQVSADGLTYTFTLREGLGYKGYRNAASNAALTAEDFVFGLQRVFLPETNSPYAQKLGSILNGPAVAAGQADIFALGVQATDDRTLVIRLSQQDEDFLSKLCLPGAMPCDRDYFESTGGTYGLSASSTLGNGPFYIYSWTASGLFLRRPAQGNSINNLRLVTPDKPEQAEKSEDDSASASSAVSLSAAQMVSDGKADAALSEVSGEGEFAEIPYISTTWVLVYNCRKQGLSNLLIRQGLSASAAQAELAFSDGYTEADGLIPPQVTQNGEPYREAAGTVRFTSHDPAALFRAGLEEAGLEKLSGIQVLIPEGASRRFSPVNQQWQKQLSAFFTVQELAPDDLRQAVEEGNFQIALYPVSPRSNDPLSLLSQFSGDNFSGWQDAAFDAACAAEAQNTSLSDRTRRMTRLESTLLEASPVTPLYYESGYLLVNPAVHGLVFDPFGPLLDLCNATRD